MQKRIILILLIIALPYHLFAENLQSQTPPSFIKQLQITKRYVDKATNSDCNYNSLKCLIIKQDIVILSEYLEMVKQGKSANDLQENPLSNLNQYPQIQNNSALEFAGNYIIYRLNNPSGSTSTIYIPKNLNYKQQMEYLKKRNSVLKDLFASGESVNKQDEFGFTSLHYAAAVDSPEIIDLLLSYGAMVFKTNNDFKLKPDNIAAILDCGNVLPKLMTICGREDIDSNRDYNLVSYYSYFGKNLAVLEQIFNFNFTTSTINVADKFGNTAIFYAAFGGNLQFLDNFIKNKQAEINIVNSDGKTLLSYMVEYYYNDIAKYLIAQGANLNLEDFSHRTPLSYAIINGAYDLTKMMLAKGANMNIYDRSNMSPLFYAIKTDNPYVLKLFIEVNNSLINVKSPDGYNLLTFALANSLYNIASYLISLGYNINDLAPDDLTPLMICAANGKIELVKALISKGASLNIKSPSSNTALSYSLSAINGDEIALLLINNGADAFVVNEDGMTAAGYASLNQKTNLLLAIINQSTELSHMLKERKYDELSLNLCTYVKQTYHGPCLYNAKAALLGK